MSPEKFTFMDYTITGLDDFKKAIEQNQNILSFKSTDSTDAIHLICTKYGHLEIIKYLKDELNYDITMLNTKKSDIAMFAAWFGQFEIIKYLHIEYNWDFYILNYESLDAYSYAQKKHPDIAKYIKENLKPTTIEKIVDEHVSKLYKQLSEKDNDIKKLEKQLSEKDNDIKKLEKQVFEQGNNTKKLEEKLVTIMGLIQ